MKQLAVLMLISFLGAAFLGFMPMDHGSHHMAGIESPCPIAAMFNAACGADAASMGIIHISALQSFLNALVSGSLLLTILLMAAGALFLILARQSGLVPAVSCMGRQDVSHIYISPQEKSRSWLSLLENSPSFV